MLFTRAQWQTLGSTSEHLIEIPYLYSVQKVARKMPA